jgi:hypothetical protein
MINRRIMERSTQYFHALLPAINLVLVFCLLVLAGCRDSNQSNTSKPSSTKTIVAPLPTTRPTNTPTVNPDFSPFVGNWDGEARQLIFNPDGHAVYSGRVFEFCNQGAPPPCDSTNGNEINGGLNSNLLFTRIVNSTAYGMIVSGTADPAHGKLLKVGDPISITLGSNDTLTFSDGWLMCGQNTPTNSQVYQTCLGG